MQNNTFEDYKNAVKKKYEIEKDGEHFVYLNNPTRAKLRNLCWELFQQQNRNQDDLNVFSSLLGLPFDVNKKNKFEEQIDKFRPIETFFKGETDPTNVDSVNLAAILVDFEARPFNKFRIQSLYQDEVQNDNLKNSAISNPETEQIDSSGILESFLDKKESEKGIETGIEKSRKKENPIEVSEIKPINLFVNFKDNFLEKFKKNLKLTIIRVVIVFGLGFGISHFVFPKKQCMQWSNDHYEKIDCDLKSEGSEVSNVIEPFDEIKFGLKKIHVTDTTTCFNKNGDAIIWYAKTANGIDFFNTHGRHPENENSLKPVTRYILDKYVK